MLQVLMMSSSSLYRTLKIKKYIYMYLIESLCTRIEGFELWTTGWICRKPLPLIYHWASSYLASTPKKIFFWQLYTLAWDLAYFWSLKVLPWYLESNCIGSINWANMPLLILIESFIWHQMSLLFALKFNYKRGQFYK